MNDEGPPATEPVPGLTDAFPAVGSPLRIGPTTLRNRVFVSAHTTNLAASHEVSTRHLDYHRRRALGGVGLIVTEGLRVHPTSLRRPETLSVWTDACVPGLTRLATTVHDAGALLFGQLLHSGREAADDYTRIPSWGPSQVAWGRGAPVPHELEAGEIDELVTCFAAATRRVVASGFDGVELHLGHGHLLQQFLSPVSNHREDRFGVDGRGRIELVDRILTAIAIQLPRERMAFGIRVSGDEFVPGGLDLDAMLQITAGLVARHRLDFVDVSHSAYIASATLSTQIPDMAYGPAPFAHIPTSFRQRLPGTPILMAGRVESIGQAEQLLRIGTADAVAMTRASIADPDVVVKAGAGRKARRCVACNQLCIGRTSTGLPLSCVVNPEVGLESRWEQIQRDVGVAISEAGSADGRRPQLVMVVGSGPAGLEAALTLQPFVRVEVVDALDGPGGSLRSAARLPNRGKWRDLIEDQYQACRDGGVRFRFGTHLHLPDGIAAASAVVLATGATREPRSVGGSTPMLLAERLGGTDVAGEHDGGVAVVHDDVGSWPGFSATEHLLAAGFTVHYVTPLTALAPRITIYSRLGLLERLEGKDLHVHLGVVPQAWTGRGLELVPVVGHGSTRIAPVDLLVDVGEALSPPPLDLPVPSIVVGDRYAPRDVGWAVWSGRVGALRLLVRLMVQDRSERERLEDQLTALPLAPVELARNA